ncbi:MAG TPA: NADH-quinone oxidoreductase subunit NuoF [Candidatus Eisenbacteria bacterium]|nr:NADH-quinone oxidoreductase subunit NuoF [Candidatus Eisenbacteria bacterium]
MIGTGELVLTKTVHLPNSHTLDVYRQHGGYTALETALKKAPDDIIDVVKRSGLRGRGGAGFPAGTKWGFVPKSTDKPKYLCVNADESEPGAFKDRLICAKDPHQLLEGTLIACHAIGARRAYIYIRGEFAAEARVLNGAIEEARRAGLIGTNILGSGFDCEVSVYRGAGAYICGEETGLIESIEGKRGNPRLKPPFPAVVGLFGCPTVVNNVETIACVPHIVNRGWEWFAGIGTERNTGPKLYGISGHVNKPGVYEAPMGYNLKQLIDDFGGGVRGGRPIKAVIPGGASCPVLRGDEIDVPMDFDSMTRAGSLFGTGTPVVMDDSVCMVRAAWITARFFAHESCGQCTPCREGAGWLQRLLWRIETGEGQEKDIDTLLSVTDQIEGNTICALGDAAAWPARGFAKKFRDEFLQHIREKRCPLGGGSLH